MRFSSLFSGALLALAALSAVGAAPTSAYVPAPGLSAAGDAPTLPPHSFPAPAPTLHKRMARILGAAVDLARIGHGIARSGVNRAVGGLKSTKAAFVKHGPTFKETLPKIAKNTVRGAKNMIVKAAQKVKQFVSGIPAKFKSSPIVNNVPKI